jgi:MFS family permease
MIISKIVYYCIELFCCYATVFYSNFLFFYMKSKFGFGEIENLLLAAFGGLVYTFAAWQGGAFAQRFGCYRSLFIGLIGMALSLIAGGLLLHSAPAQVIVFAVWTASVCFIWPALEALISENAGDALPGLLGWYNVIWAGGGAIAYFTAGIILERIGMQTLFWLPLSMIPVPVALVAVAANRARKEKSQGTTVSGPALNHKPANSKQFLHLAWLANPLSYVAINTLIPLIPSIASKLGLSTSMAGITCSVWMFARLAAFILLRRWSGWHYRFLWLAGAFGLMVGCFAVLILSPTIALFMVAELGFGFSIGLIYYSSLYYSMNASERQGAHGGLHEAMIGAGLFVGPACGASTLFFLPSIINAGAWSVCGLLVMGFSGLLYIGRTPDPGSPEKTGPH